MKAVCNLMGKRTSAVPLALPLIAALTPAHWCVRILDEEIDPLDIDALRAPGNAPDLVGITALNSNVTRGYEIADAFQCAGIPVIMGGPEVSFKVEESLTHCDAVVIGEAEGVWRRILRDVERGRLSQVYQSAALSEFRQSPIPRWDLVDTSKVMTTVVQVSRGCPNRCRFCVVSKLFGKTQRYRDVDDVIAEIAASPIKEIAFADDNLLADRDFAREFLAKLEPLGVSWSCQSSIDVGLEPEMVDSMARAGCRTVLFGFESVNTESLDEANKSHNLVERYSEVIENMHRAGIHVLASFLVGFDADTPDVFENISRFVRQNKLSMVMVNSLSPFPGTVLHRSLERQGRLLPMRVDDLVLFYPMMRYRHLSPIEICDRGLELLRELYSYERLLEKAPDVLGSGAFTHDDGAAIPATTKLRSTFNLLYSHLLTGGPEKRKLFLELFSLVKDQRATPGDVVRYLLFMESQNEFLDYAEGHMEEAKRHIRLCLERAETMDEDAA